MKPLLVIPIIVAAVIGLSAGALIAAGVHIHPAEPLAAAIIALAATIAGLIPVLRGSRTDPVAFMQAALVGTVLHLLVASIFAGTLLFTHLVQGQISFVLWLMVGYWISLILIIRQMRQILVNFIALPKVHS